MSEVFDPSDPVDAVEPMKTLATSGLYVDRRVFGPEVTALTDRLAAIGAPYEGVGINVPNKVAVPNGPCDFKTLAVELVANKEVESNRRLLGHVSKFAAMATLVESVPTIVQPMSEIVEDDKVVFSHLLVDTDEYSGDTFFSLFPDERTFKQLRIEQIQSWMAIAAIANVDVSDIIIKKPHFDLRLAFVRGDVSYKVIQRMTDVLREQEEIVGDMMPGINPEAYFTDPDLQPAT